MNDVILEVKAQIPMSNREPVRSPEALQQFWKTCVWAKVSRSSCGAMRIRSSWGCKRQTATPAGVFEAGSAYSPARSHWLRPLCALE